MMKEPENNNSPLIRLEHISKSFGPIRANRDISLDIHAGRIKALLGENGAGKSTLMSILAGRLQPDGGRIQVDGVEMPISTPASAHAIGIGMVYQHFMLVDALTVSENVILGQSKGIWLSTRNSVRQVRDLAERYGFAIDPSERVSALSMGERQRVEILKLLHRRSRLLIFDEPTAVLTPLEIDQLFDALRQMAAQGKAIVFISHKLDEVMALADEVAIMRKGEIVSEMPIGQVSSKADLARKMVGREVVLQVRKEPLEPRQAVLHIDRLSGGGLTDVQLQVRQGEVLGVVGVAGNGQKPLVETICGLRKPGSGEIKILGKNWAQFYAHHSWDKNLIYIPEDRRGLATCLDLDLVDNFLLTTRQGFSLGPWLLRRKAAAKTRELMLEFDVQPPEPSILAHQLSGGNLQKIVLAREFYRRPRLIVAEQPTQGLDVGATEEIWRVLLKARSEAGILLVTCDLNEALSLSDRITVLFGGRIMDTFATDETEKVDRIGLLMAGVAFETAVP
ncbi:MAG: ABC transporter ATP-binding protein [Desulfobacterales bacterium]